MKLSNQNDLSEHRGGFFSLLIVLHPVNLSHSTSFILSLQTRLRGGESYQKHLLQAHIPRDSLTCVSFPSCLRFSRESTLIFPTWGLVPPSQPPRQPPEDIGNSWERMLGPGQHPLGMIRKKH